MKLQGKVALVSGRDMGMARSIALCFSMEGARVALCNVADAIQARELRTRINAQGRICMIVGAACDGRDSCRHLVEGVVAHLGRLDILVNCGSAENPPGTDPISCIEDTFRSSAFAYLHLMAAALPYLPEGGSIINSSSLDAAGDDESPARAAAESAIVALTRSFAAAASSRGVRVNAVARMGVHDPATRAASSVGLQPVPPVQWEHQVSGLGAACVFLASPDSVRISGQVFQINLGGICLGRKEGAGGGMAGPTSTPVR